MALMEQPLDFSAGSKKRKLEAPEFSPTSSDAMMGAGDGEDRSGAGSDVIARVSLHHAPGMSGMSSPEDSGREMSPRESSPQSSLHVQDKFSGPLTPSSPSPTGSSSKEFPPPPPTTSSHAFALNFSGGHQAKRAVTSSPPNALVGPISPRSHVFANGQNGGLHPFNHKNESLYRSPLVMPPDPHPQLPPTSGALAAAAAAAAAATTLNRSPGSIAHLFPNGPNEPGRDHIHNLSKSNNSSPSHGNRPIVSNAVHRHDNVTDPNVKVFKCTMCPYATKHRSNLYIHIRKHTGEKPYWCIACKARFSQLHPLKQHVINKHGGNSDLIRMDKKEGRTRYINHWSSQDQVQFVAPPNMGNHLTNNGVPTSSSGPGNGLLSLQNPPHTTNSRIPPSLDMNALLKQNQMLQNMFNFAPNAKGPFDPLQALGAADQLKNAAEQIKAVAAAAAGQAPGQPGAGDVGGIGNLLETGGLFNQQLSAQKLAQLAGLGNNYQQYFANEAMKQLAAAAKASNDQRSSPGPMSPHNAQNGKHSPSLSPLSHAQRSEADANRNREKPDPFQRNFGFPPPDFANADSQGPGNKDREALERSLAEKMKMPTSSSPSNAEAAAQAALLKQINDLAGRGFPPGAAGLAGLLDQGRFRQEEKYADAGFFSDLARLIPDSEESILPLMRKFQGNPNHGPHGPISPRFNPDLRLPVLSRPPSADHILRNGNNPGSPRSSRPFETRSPSPRRPASRDRSPLRDDSSSRDRSPSRVSTPPRDKGTPRSPRFDQEEEGRDGAAPNEGCASDRCSEEGKENNGNCGCSSKSQLRDLRANVLELITMLVPDFDLGQKGREIDLNSSKVDDLITEFISGVSAK